MASLYNIQQELIDIFDNIEANEGEITNEEYESLVIKQEELNEKLTNYVKAIQVWSGDAETCKCEKKRINDVQNKYKNRIDRLKANMLKAVKMFGEQGKTNKFIELPIARLSTRETFSIGIYENRINLLLSHIESYLKEVVENDVLAVGENVDLQGVLDVINANCKAEIGETFEPFTIADLKTLQIKVSTTMPLSVMFEKGEHLIKNIVENNVYTDLENDTSKDEWKKAIITVNDEESDKITLANIYKEDSLQIK